jgi:peptidyl-prolyl cis-trans isomerase B (cyclophilin B)
VKNDYILSNKILQHHNLSLFLRQQDKFFNMKKIVLAFLLLTLTTSTFAKKHKNKFVVIETTMGTIKVEVYADVKQHADNFLKLAGEGFFDSILFHRVIPSFMIQAGDPKSKSASKGELLGNGDLGYKVPAEFMDQYHHRQGALAAARDNNPEKASSACQFYIVQGKTYTDSELDGIEQSLKRKMTEQARKDYKTFGGTPHLDGSYTVFGQLVEGQDVVQKITMAPRNNTDRPLEDIRIVSTKIKKKNKHARH